MVGEDALSVDDKFYLSFLHEFEQKFLKQSPDENRSIFQSLDIGWSIFKSIDFPRRLLVRISPEVLDEYY